MFKIFKNGVLYKITNSTKCVENIVDSFLKKWAEGDTLIVEKNGKIVEQYFHF